ncbi:MAG TPA: hypothetical protein VM324_16940 [Egibacteraceae bacterium]|jgi:methyl-accepting chemotaxis protein|nr:hypothetical protein [Egibacteraceae bacterium]
MTTKRLHARLYSDEQGLAGAALVIVIAWALAAVLMLTGTLVAAQSIDERVFEIRNLVTDIGSGTEHVALTQEINASAAAIRDAAAPLSGQLDQVIESAGSIDGTVTQILDTAGQINQMAAGQINPNVLAIGTSEAAIQQSVNGIHATFSTLLPVVHSIQQGVADINSRADGVIALGQGIKSDTGAIIEVVGTENTPSILGHAASIDCNSIVVVLGLLSGSGCVS